MTRAGLAALVGAMSKGPWEAQSASSAFYLPTLIARVYRDEQGRRCTSFLAILSGASLPNDENAAGIVALRNHAEKLLAVCEAAEAVPHPASCSLTAYGYPCDCELQELRAKLRDLEGA